MPLPSTTFPSALSSSMTASRPRPVPLSATALPVTRLPSARSRSTPSRLERPHVVEQEVGERVNGLAGEERVEEDAVDRHAPGGRRHELRGHGGGGGSGRRGRGGEHTTEPKPILPSARCVPTV